MGMKNLHLSLLILPAISTAVCAISQPTHGQCEVTQLDGNDGVGFAATDGNVAVIGDSVAFGFLGAAYVYRKGPDGPDDWTFEATLVSPNPSTTDGYGRSVAVGGNIIVVSAHNADAPAFHSGAAYIFRYDPKTMQWSLEATLTATDSDSVDRFGWSVDIEGDVALIGARSDDNNGVTNAGAAYIFRYNSQLKQWIEEAKLTDPNVDEGDLLGFSVSISGDVALVGAPVNEDAGGGTGAAFIFRHDPDNPSKWILEQQLQAFDAQFAAAFGRSVSLQGDVALIGAPQLDSQNGAAYVMRFDGKEWVHEAKLLATNPVGPFPLMGTGVSLSADGTTALAGAPLDYEAGNQSGAIHVFHKNAGKWTETVKLTASDGGPGQDFGESLALSGDMALIKGGGKGYIFIGMSALDCNTNGEPDACDIFDGQSVDQNNNGIPDQCDADLDGNGIVNTSDLLILFSNWGPCGDCEVPGSCLGDLDNSCSVNTSDILILFSNWG